MAGFARVERRCRSAGKDGEMRIAVRDEIDYTDSTEIILEVCHGGNHD